MWQVFCAFFASFLLSFATGLLLSWWVFRWRSRRPKRDQQVLEEVFSAKIRELIVPSYDSDSDEDKLD
jgi:hypothetical protein